MGQFTSASVPVWNVLEVLKKEVRWRVGNGKNIRIWKDKWLPHQENFLPRMSIRDWNENGFVKDLIN